MAETTTTKTAASNAGGEVNELFPPRDKRARRLWHELEAFKKHVTTRGDKGTVLDLPPDSSYMRACAHHFGERLGLATESISSGDTKFVQESADVVAAKKRAKEGYDEDASASQQPQQPSVGLRREFIKRFSMCAKSHDPEAAKVAFEELRASGEACTPGMCSILLHVFSEAPTPMLNEAISVFEAVKETGGVPDEGSWSGLIKLYCKGGRPEEALTRVDEMIASGQEPKLRSMSPMLAYAADAGDKALADATLQKIRSRGLTLGPPEHIDLVRLAHSTAPTPQASRSAVSEALSNMARDGPLLSEAHVESLKAVFASSASAAAAANGGSDGDGGGAASSGGAASWRIETATSDEDGKCSLSGVLLRPIQLRPSERDALRETIPHMIGPKGKTAEFHKFTQWLSDDIRKNGPYDYVLDGANIGYFGHSKQENAYRKAKAAAAFAAQSAADEQILQQQKRRAASAAESNAHDWDGRRSAEHKGSLKAFATNRPYTHSRGASGASWPHPAGKGGGGGGGGGSGGGGATDAQTAESLAKGTTFDYHQIDRVVQAVREAGGERTRALLVIHRNHTDSSKLHPKDVAYLDKWQREGVLYQSPHGMNDDWYWLQAAVASGERCKVVSNDEMRDHHFAMAWPPAFVRWKERHVLHFEVSHYPLPGSSEDGEGGGGGGKLPPVKLREPRPYSHAMQVSGGGGPGLGTAAMEVMEEEEAAEEGEIGEEGESSSSATAAAGIWHLPVQSEANDAWLVMRPPEA